MVLIDLDRIYEPYLHPDTNIVDALIYRGKGLDVNTVIVDGEVVLRDKKFTRIEKDEVIDEFKSSLSRPLAPHEISRGELSKEILPHIQKWFEGWNLDRGTPHYFYNNMS